MKSAIRLAVGAFCALLAAVPLSAEGLRERMLRAYALEAGLVRAEDTALQVNPAVVEAGRMLFESKLLSFRGDIACQDCHLERFGSADGLPIAIGPGGVGEGPERLLSGGDVLPRNVLPLWGRGGLGFDVFFWDGRVEKIDGVVRSQFGDAAPSDDALAAAAHLPLVQIDEMVPDTDEVEILKVESLSVAGQMYRQIVSRLLADEKMYAALKIAFNVQTEEIHISHVAEALAAFIRHRFRLQETRFHRFVFDGAELDDKEVSGGILFYGKGHCSSCHNGPYFTDFAFRSVPLGQFGFGMNGFGVDYGRYNVTLDPRDLYAFRTPPLYDVADTRPYSHSGSIPNLKNAIRAHVDPLASIDPSQLDDHQRSEFYRQLRAWSREAALEGVFLDEDELDSLVSFLKTLDIDDSGF